MSAPPTLASHDPAWADAFRREAARIAQGGAASLRLHHIGSTAIPGILAKPIIDMLGVAPSAEAFDAASPALESFGYEAMGAYGIPGRWYYRRSDANGTRTHHLHAFVEGSAGILRHLAFRDYLRSFPDRAAAYSALKADLVAAPGATWESYMDGKDPFVRDTERTALRWVARR